MLIILGAIPKELFYLPNLYVLQLEYNALHGSLPKYSSVVSYLLILDLSYNRLTGSISDKLRLDHLNSLQLSNNLFTSTLPSYLASLSSTLRYLDLSSNKLSGYIIDILI